MVTILVKTYLRTIFWHISAVAEIKFDAPVVLFLLMVTGGRYYASMSWNCNKTADYNATKEEGFEVSWQKEKICIEEEELEQN